MNGRTPNLDPGEEDEEVMPLPALIASLLDPGAYPDRPQEVRLIQTHISYVLLAGEVVYKIKKPVNLGFVDYSTLRKRHFYCQEEIRLNARLCPEIYLGVVPVVKTKRGPRLEGKGRPVEYAVKMKRLDDDRMMDGLVLRGEATPEMLREVARTLAEFHEKAECSERTAAYGSVETIRQNTEENFTQTENFVDIVLTRGRYEFIETYTRGFISRAEPFFKLRVDRGRIRDGHGDLHLGNICYLERPCIYDCIEFSERFRCGDVASEVAFLAMDLDFHGRADLARVFVDTYVEAAKDGDLLELLDFYKCYRAFVRGKVRSLPLDAEETSYDEKRFDLDEAKRYFDLAYRYAGGKTRPVLTVIGGLPGTGKSSLAKELGDELGLVVISSDVVRKRLAGLDPSMPRHEAYQAGIYSEEMTRRTYLAMADDAAKLMAAGHSVILDATFGLRWQRQLARATAERVEGKFLFIECMAPEAEIRRRLAERQAAGESVSDADFEIYLEQKRRFEPAGELEENSYVCADTGSDVSRVVKALSERLASS